MYYGNRIRFPRHRSADARITWLGNIPLVDVLQSNISHLCSSPSHRQQDYDPFCSIGGRFTSSSNALFSSAFSNSKLAPAKSYQGYPEGQTVGCRVWCVFQPSENSDNVVSVKLTLCQVLAYLFLLESQTFAQSRVSFKH
jgi:hypothetical protein